MNLLLTKPGIEPTCIEELSNLNVQGAQFDDGIVEFSSRVPFHHDLCFCSWMLLNCTNIGTAKGFKAKNEIIDWYCTTIKNEKVETSWPLIWLQHSDNGYVLSTSKAQELSDLLKKRMSRISRLAKTEYPESGSVLRGLYIIDTPTQLLISNEALFFGQRRMKDDPQAPSRSYLKIEEALAIFGHEPSVGHTVADLGAAPGGWSYAAARRGATVFAIDNGPLKKGASDHEKIYHERADAFKWQPPKPVDWLFCDMVDLPQKVMPRIELWIKNRWCHYGIVNFKFGHSDAGTVLKQVMSEDGLLPLVSHLQCRHLFHDRDEITVMFEV